MDTKMKIVRIIWIVSTLVFGLTQLYIGITGLVEQNVLNAWYRNGTDYGFAINDHGGIDETGLFLCPTSPMAPALPSLVVDC